MTATHATEQTATASGDTFVCYARDDQAFVITLCEGMRARGVPAWLDQWSIEPGADWNRAIEDAITRCDTVLIVLSPAAVASEEVGGELRAALDARKRIIPLLYRPCRIPRRLLLKQRVDFTHVAHVGEPLLDHLAQVLLGGRRDRPFPLSTEQEEKGRRTLMEDVSDEASVRLRLLGTESPVSLLLEYQPHQVARTWDDEAITPSRPTVTPAAIDITAVFDDAAIRGKLLIVGLPGSGKTTVLLRLMQRLAARAAADDSQPIPVLISLASWNTAKTIGDWAVEELKIKYGVRLDLGARWRDTGKITLLLDALDEVPAEDQRACVEAINQFLQTYRPAQLVVCCRRAEYETLPVKLRLRGAVCLQPLETDQIRRYLQNTGCSDLWPALSSDPELMEMAKSPLLLSFMTALPADPNHRRWQDGASPTARRQRLFDVYVSARSLPADAEYSQAQTLHWLGELAARLKRRGSSEFLIERMQPDWLDSSAQRWSYRIGVLFVSAIAVLLTAPLLLWLVGLIPQGAVGTALQNSHLFTGGAFINSSGAYILALIVGSVIAFRGRIIPVETLTWSWPRARPNARVWAQTATLTAFDYVWPLSIAGTVVWAIYGFGAPARAMEQAGAYVGLATSVGMAFFLATIRPSTWMRSVPRRVITPRLTAALAAASVYGVATGFVLLPSTSFPEAIAMVAATLLASLSIFVTVAFSAAASAHVRAIFVRALITAAIAGAAFGVVFGRSQSQPGLNVLTWASVWTNSLVGIALAATIVAGVAIRATEWLGLPPQLVGPGTFEWRKTAAAGLAIGISLGLLGATVASTWRGQPIRDLSLFGLGIQSAFVQAAVAIMLGAISVTTGMVVLAVVLGALAGALSGATGADVERRLVPNQGIRHSALNVLVFAGLGTLVIGVPYGLLNLSIATLAVRKLPDAADWLRLCLGAGLPFGVLAGFIPGAACIQHFVLRFVLWASGSSPLKCERFLNFATRRRLLQRVGGRYRFIHVLLQEHLASTRSSPAPAYQAP